MADEVAKKSAQDVTTYQCPNCGAPLIFDPTSHDLICEHCDTHVPVARAASTPASKPSSKKKTKASNELEDAVVYKCENCGAQLVTSPTTVATTCPYCENNVVLDPEVSGVLRPDGVIPFSFDKSKVSEALTNFYADKPLLPNDFFDVQKVEKAQGVYVPFWLFDGRVDGSVTMSGTRSSIYREGDYQVTETRHYRLYREGDACYSNVPVDGSSHMDNDLMDSIEPYDMGGMRTFDGAYLSGFVADRYDQDAKACFPRAGVRMKNSALAAFRNTAGAYESVGVVGENLSFKDTAAAYILFPVWLFNGHYEEKIYRYAINGQTGKVVGDLPISFAKGVKSFFFGLLLGAVAGAILWLLYMLISNYAIDQESVKGLLGWGGIAGLIGAIAHLAMDISAMKTVKVATSAQGYTSRALRLRESYDRYTHTTYTRVRVETDNNSRY